MWPPLYPGVRTSAFASLLLVPALAADPTPPAQEAPTGSFWPMFRGNPQLTGVAPGELALPLAVRWQRVIGEPVLSSGAIVSETVYLGADDGFLYALKLQDGSVRWKYESGEAIRSSPLVLGGLVVFGNEEGAVHAVSTETGEKRWSFETDGPIISSVNHESGRLVFGSYDGSVYCLSASDGALIWKFQTEGRIHGTPGIIAEHVVVAGCDQHLRIVRLKDGAQAGSVDMGSVSGASAAVRGSMVYVGTYAGLVLGLDWKNARVAWTFDDPDQDQPVLSSAALTPDLVVIGGRDKMLRAFDPTGGHVRWTFRAKGRIDSSPVICGAHVFFGSMDGTLHALELTSGSPIWQFVAGGPISASPAIAAGCLVVGTEEGVVYCLCSA